MKFDYEGKAQDDGIIFTYDNYNRAIYFRREEGEIKEYEITANEMSLKVQYKCALQRQQAILVKFILIIFSFVLFDLTDVKTTYIYALISMLTFVYIVIKIYSINISRNKTTYTTKQYHAAEHMILNCKDKNVSVSQLKKFNAAFSNTCGSNVNCIDIMSVIIASIDIIFWCELFIFVRHETIGLVILWAMLSIQIDSINYLVLVLQSKKGIFNNIVQPLFIKTPTDEQLELAIYGYKRIQELDDELSRKKEM